ncbi:serine hydrolase FSH [Annulohypoxylon maeteangense]|uniref:serine hydrolase FSH n=1 Tax=Annulohypoxylon maeteangense TaxID=1927788 RepID=UPI002007C5E2|nr:serine hydrolase FSH [Annulohypoxylon maeteangense]KAI0882900.1 serine hydrolase FSH [Annulohypoxylon maeteangense]
MKVLCLQDGGRNKKAFKANLDFLLGKLRDLNNTVLLFDFFNNPLKCSNLPMEDSSHLKPHHLILSDQEYVKNIRKASEQLGNKLDSDGPYDGVIAFSQGAVVVSSFLLYRQWYDDGLPPAFKFAIFVSGGISLQVLKDLGVPIPEEAENAVSEATLQRNQELGPLSAHVTKARRAVFNSDDCFGLNLNRIPLELKIRIPTVHIWGEKDPLFPSSIHLTGLCDPYIRKIYTHSGGHEIPQEESELVQIVPLIEWCIQRGSWPGQMQL